ncbi:MAG TPA: sulfate adenylyltransferase subunit CysN [Candidatus Acidoferrum sp.]
MPATAHAEPLESLDGFLEQNLGKELLRFTTAGSVDDGKSTLIGRLLHESAAVYEDQLAAIKKSRLNRSTGPIDFSLLTDGLRAEREQGITIDVAYRYFSTAKRKFIIADTPGHEQYTRNMATGASTADLAVILVDATKGLLPQTRRHAYIASLLGIPNVLAAINKMDLVAYQEVVFRQLEHDFAALAHHLRIPFVQCVPVSALEGDNLVARSEKTPWYFGPILLEHLETVPLRQDHGTDALRFPVQSVIRPDRNFRGFAGRLASGVIRPGDAVLALPSGQQTRVQTIVSYDGDLEEAIPSQSVVLKLEREIDLSRGDMLVSPVDLPQVSNRFAAMVVWLDAEPMRLNRSYLVKHAGRQVKAKSTRIRFRIDVNSLTEHPASELEMNGIADVEFEASVPLFFDSYNQNRTTGSFILIDPISNATVGAAMIREDLSRNERANPRPSDLLERPARSGRVTREERHQRQGHRSAVFSVVGNRAFAERLERSLFERGFHAVLVSAEDDSSTLLPVLSVLRETGAVIIHSSATLSREQQAVLTEFAGEFLFEIPVSEKNEEEALKQALDLAKNLRLSNWETGERKVDRDAVAD